MRDFSTDAPRLRLGIDLGGSKIELIALSPKGQEILRRRVPTPQNDYLATVAAVVALVHQTEAELGQGSSIGIGTPGAVSPASGLMKNCNSTCLNGRPLKEDLERALNREVRLANDANCLALSEATDGTAAGAESVFGVILGTGVGGGVVVRGHALNGVNAIAGEWGHSPLPYFQFTAAPFDRTPTGSHPATGEALIHPWPSPREIEAAPACYCGKKGCIETWLSGPGFAADHVRYGGEDLPAVEIAQLAAAGYGPCSATLARYEERLARALAGVINLLDPDVIVLGGGMSNIARLYDTVPLLWRRYVFSDRVDTRLAPPRFGDSSGVRGAAWLWNDDYA
ncbi:MAG TPA: ROK family protein [Thiobacillus sp.]|nr:MAG: fructokinase [Hydrogenophilales bacterium 28-61-11]OYZ58709.1 MAG: fructokinase [Hydrogenophilales bacterium 16-61-112]OZA50965.1 MAG: fructokinase [Hydrogenophilales bacterium 17-61-76]HQT30756.1 ROK family protein [Thiobacillus sp.]HQT69560.1 ROK family protein [Thiobacillus sp.]